MGYTAIVGNQGSGKSTLMAMIVGQEARRYGRIAANMDISFTPMRDLDWHKMPKGYRGDFDPGDVDFLRFRNDLHAITIAMLSGRHIFFDDLTALFDSHYWELVPPEIRLFLSTHRHYKCFMTYSTPMWARVDIDIRKNTDRILHVQRKNKSRWLKVTEYWVRPDQEDPEGKLMKTGRQHLFPKYIKLPFQPKDDQYPVDWPVIKRVAHVVGDMFDSWAPIELAAHVVAKKSRRGRTPLAPDPIDAPTLSAGGEQHEQANTRRIGDAGAFAGALDRGVAVADRAPGGSDPPPPGRPGGLEAQRGDIPIAVRPRRRKKAVVEDPDGLN
jgi:energy-coupling factor transporter ATP-binding protein EcfA2